MEQKSDEECFKVFLEGENWAMEELVQRHEVPLMGFLMRYTLNREMAEDAFQETFLKVFRKKHLFDASRSFRPWLFQIAVNTARDLFRKKKPTGNLDNIEEPHSPSQESPLRRLSSHEIGQRIQEELGKLNEIQRSVFLLREFEDLSYAEISKILDRPENTLKSDMRRALQQLRSALEEVAKWSMDEMEPA